ncbi:MAG: hypothetical protein ACP5HQ_03705 [Thermoprotei archaeon]
MPKPILQLNEATSFALAILSIALYFITAGALRSLDPVYFVVIPVLAATTAIVPHELAHKYAGRSMGCFARFVLDSRGFLLTSLINVALGLLSHVGLTFGAVFFSGYTYVSCPFVGFSAFRSPNYGVIKAVGPISNMVLAIAFGLASASAGFNAFLLTFFTQAAYLNAWVAFFNLLPFGPLDGRGVYEWNVAAWGALFIFSLVLSYLIPWYIG